MQSKIFISYSWKDKDIADSIDDDWKAVGITLDRDIKDLEYKQDIKDFMSRVKTTDYVLLLISRGYLESKNCMYEALEIFEDADFKKKILPILTDDVKIHSADGRLKYIHYWQRKIDNLEKEIRKLKSSVQVSSIYQELDDFSKIRASIDNFINRISSIFCVFWPEVKKENYRLLFKEIGLKEDSTLDECFRIRSIADTEDQELASEDIMIKYPTNQYVLFLNAYLATEAKKTKKAKKYYEKLIEIYPDSFIAHNDLAILLVDHFNEHELAKQHYEQALIIDPNAYGVHNNLALLLASHFKEYELAKQHHEQALVIDPNFSDAHYNLAILLANCFKEYRLAKQHYKQALLINPNNARYHNNLASLLANHLKEYQLARHHYEQALAIDPNMTMVHYNLAFLYNDHLNEYDLARKHYIIAIRLNPGLKSVEIDKYFKV